MRASRVSCAVLSGALAIVAMGAAPASAEGKRSSYISNWATSTESDRWTDNNTDAAKTAVKFSRCKAPSSPGRASAKISLRKDVVGPDANYGQKGDVCVATQRWGDQSKGRYYFTLDRINGRQGPGTFHLNARPVEIWY